MPGLDLRTSATAGLRAGTGPRYGNSPAPATATEAAFGTANAPSSGAAAALAPTHPAGVVLWVGVVCVAALVLIYHSLPK